MSENVTDDRTCDVIFSGAAHIFQPRRGYRFGTDALLLATDLPPVSADATIVDLGSAHGPVSLAIASKNPHAKVIAVERQPVFFELLVESIALNDFSRVEALLVDVREIRTRLKSHSADLVVCNPPYFREGEQRISSDVVRAQAHHELNGVLKDFIDAARYVLKPTGYLKLITPPLRIPDVFLAISGTDLRMKSMRFVHSRPDRDAYLVEYVLRRGAAPDFQVRPPLFLHELDGTQGMEVSQRLKFGCVLGEQS